MQNRGVAFWKTQRSCPSFSECRNSDPVHLPAVNNDLIPPPNTCCFPSAFLLVPTLSSSEVLPSSHRPSPHHLFTLHYPPSCASPHTRPGPPGAAAEQRHRPTSYPLVPVRDPTLGRGFNPKEDLPPCSFFSDSQPLSPTPPPLSIAQRRVGREGDTLPQQRG